MSAAQEPTTPAADTALTADDLPPAQDPSFMLRIILPRSLGSFSVRVTPTAIVQEIRSHIIESQEGQFYTCFHLEFNGKALPDNADLASIEGFDVSAGEPSVYMVEDAYNDRELRVQIARFREILTNFQSNMTSASDGIDSGMAYLPAVSGAGYDLNSTKTPAIDEASDVIDASPFKEYDLNKDILAFESVSKLAPVAPNAFASLEPSLRSLTLSPWNPPLPPRRLAGDLLYLSAITAEGTTLAITCSVAGFYVTRTTGASFDPTPRTPIVVTGTLPALLAQHSPLFAARFPTYQKAITSRHPFEYFPIPNPSHPWICNPTYSPDASRAIDTQLIHMDAPETFASRDWNEDLQTARELPTATPLQRIHRDAALHRISNEFMQAATTGVKNIVDGLLMPLNPDDERRLRMYVHNGIFYSYGADAETYAYAGGLAAAHVAVGKDVDGVSLLNGFDVDGLATVGTIVVDYKGQRMVAQSVVPGVLKRQMDAQMKMMVFEERKAAALEKGEACEEECETENIIDYGSIDMGKTIVSNDKFKALSKEIAKHLHLDESTVVDAKGVEHVMHTCVDTKGIIGNDGRHYMIELSRLLPLDIEFLDEMEKCSETDSAYPHKLALIRAELLDLFYESKIKEHLLSKNEEYEAMKKKAEDAGEKFELELEAYLKEHMDYDVKLSVNAFALTPEQEGSDVEKVKKQKETVRDLSKFLQTKILTGVATELATKPASVPVDGERMTQYLHARGINMRYLGKLVELLEKPEFETSAVYARDLLKQEMVARAAKSMLRQLLEDTPAHFVQQCVSHFLNCLFADSTTTVSLPVTSAMHAHLKTSQLPYELLTPASVDAQIRKLVHSKFRYSGASLPVQLAGVRRVPLLRSVCLKVGIQIAARDYKWSAQGDGIFTPKDIVSLYPVVKSPSTKCLMADQLFENAIYTLRQNAMESGMMMLEEAAQLYIQVFGGVHHSVAQIFKQMAVYQNKLENYEDCLHLQRKLLMIGERIHGFDDPDTLNQYMILAFFEEKSGNIPTALKYLHYIHRHYISLCASQPHPELATLTSHIANLLNEIATTPAQTAQALEFYKRAADLFESMYGREDAMTVRSYEQLCAAMISAEDFKGALKVHGIIFEYLEKKEEEGSEILRHAQALREVLTRRVEADEKKHVGDQAGHDTAKPKFKPPTMDQTKKPAVGGKKDKGKKQSNTTVPVPAAVKFAANKAKNVAPAAVPMSAAELNAGQGVANKGHLSVDDLIKFIEGGSTGKKGKKKVAKK